jgi:hypothetical protein
MHVIVGKRRCPAIGVCLSADANHHCGYSHGDEDALLTISSINQNIDDFINKLKY